METTFEVACILVKIGEELKDNLSIRTTNSTMDGKLILA